MASPSTRHVHCTTARTQTPVGHDAHAMTEAKNGEGNVSSSTTQSASDASSTPSTMAKPAANSGPPPEKPAETRMRSLIIVAFWVVIVFLGLPMWWKTTSIYRADLPLDEMSSGKVVHPFSTR